MDLIAGDIVEGRVLDFGSDGEGIIKIDGYPVFVPYAIKGEDIRAKIVYVKKDCAFGEIAEIINASPSRIKPRCPYYGKCGGCDLQHVDREMQLEIKRETVRRALLKNAGTDFDVPTPVRLNDWEYRNKMSLPFYRNPRSGNISLGFYGKRSHKVIPIKWCPLHGEWAGKAIAAVTEWANEHDISVYDEGSGKGLLRHAVFRYIDSLSVTIVINGVRLPETDSLVQKLKAHFETFTVYISVNTKHNNVIMGDTVNLVYGEEKPQNLGAFKAVVSPKSFLQVNDSIRDAIYDRVAEELDGFDGDIVELYSGIGLLSAQIAIRLPGANIVSVEIERSASENAVSLMKSLGLSERVNCILDDAKHFCGNAEFSDRRRALVIDPPRRGCDKEVLTSAKGFEKIVYISCNPQTLARDIKILSEEYALTDVQPYEMFPETAEIETVAVLKPKHK